MKAFPTTPPLPKSTPPEELHTYRINCIQQAENLNILWGALLVEELLRNQIDYFCLSPGSRCTPLTVAAARHPQAKTRVCLDERGAAFHALGYARATGKPAVLICTSGTAAANYLPAVIEASVEHIPMLILSADRPPELLATGANQTIHQPELFGKYTRWSFQMPCSTEEISPKMVLTTIDQAVHQSKGSPSGVCHINLAFREPLAPTPKSYPKEYTRCLEKWLEHQSPFTTYTQAPRALSQATIEQLSEHLQTTEKGLLVIGRLPTFLQSPAEEQALEQNFLAQCKQLAQKLKWPIFADIASGLRQDNTLKECIHYGDQLLLSPVFRQTHTPETILHLGGPLVSKRFLQFTEHIAPEHYILVQEHPNRIDPAHVVTWRIEAQLHEFAKTLHDNISERPDTQWLQSWQQHNRQVYKTIAGIMEDNMASETPGEAVIASLISKHIPEQHGLFLANSMPIRDMDMFAFPREKAPKIAANRGASGIDGLLACATGFAMGIQAPTTLFIGDLSTLHDLNGLMLAQSNEYPLILVVLNNSGGGIFHFLPIASHQEVFENYFGTPHHFTFQASGQSFGLEVHHPKTLGEFAQVYQKALQSKRSTLIEVTTDREQNLLQHREIAKTVQHILSKDIPPPKVSNGV